MPEMFREIRFAARRLLRVPMFSALVVGLLALAIGATVAVFSIVDGVLLKALPYPAADELVLLQRQTPQGSFSSFAPAELVDFRTRLEGFVGAVGYGWQNMELTAEGASSQVRAASVSSDFFTVLGVRPRLGRGFTPGPEGAREEARVAVVSHGFFLRQMGGDEAGALGRGLELNGERYAVIGVMPRGFALPEGVDLWLRGERDIPQPMQPLADEGEDLAAVRNMSYFSVLARRAPGTTLAQGQAALDALHAILLEEYPDRYDNRVLTLSPLRQELVGGAEGQVKLLLGAVLAVLLIACANVANLLLARATAQEREAAIRSALGAGRRRMVWTTLLESGLLALAGGVLGTLGAYLGLDALLALAPRRLPFQEAMAVDGRVLLFALGLSLGTALLAGLLPAWQLSSLDPGRFLQEGGRGGEGRRRHRLRQLLVTLEVAVALVLLIGAGLLMVSLFNLRSTSPGFQPEGVVMARLDLPAARYPEQAQRTEFYRQVLADVGQLPGIQGVALGASTPFSGSMISLSFEPEGYEAGEDERLIAGFTAVSETYFQTLAIPVLAGRGFTTADLHSDQGVAVVSQTLAERFYPGGEAVGRRLWLGRGPGQEDPGMLIIGVVGDVLQGALDSTPEPTIYQPYTESDWGFMTLLVRSSGDPTPLVGEVRARIHTLDPRLPTESIGLLTGSIERTLAERHALLVLLGIFAGVALLLAAVGLYALMAYTVRQRFHEIGIRMALGARRPTVVAMVVRQGLLMALSGVVLGWAGAVATTRVLGRYLHGIGTTDLRTFLALAVLLLLVAALASYLPARRAARIDPTEALRYE